MIALVSLSFVIVAVVLLMVLMRRIGGGQEQRALTPELIDELSLDRYRPMARLLSTEDFQFLRSQPNYTPRMEAKIRQQRQDVFCSYLGALETDFGSLCNALQAVMVQSQQDRPDLAATLLRSKAQFTYGICKVRVQLLLFRYGWTSVDVSAVLGVFNSVRVDLCSMVPAEMGAAA